MSSFRRLEPAEIVRTSGLLRLRVLERFPDSSLGKLAGEIEALSMEADSVSREVRRPNWILRGGVIVGAFLIFSIVATAVSKANIRPDLGGVSDFVQGMDATIQSLVFIGASVWSLLSLEIRRKRGRVIEELHVLRSIAHIVDMHQLTKDPEQLLGEPTESSPERKMDGAELTRYLNYCTEMLALVSKIAAIYVQDFHDASSVDAASDVEDLAVNLSRTIWQKIVILDRVQLAER